MKEEKYQCPLCHVSHSSSSKNQNSNFYNDDKLLCSSCINNILSKEKNLIFPNDFIEHSEIKKLSESKCGNTDMEEDIHKAINNSILEEIKKQSLNKTLIQEIKQQSNNKSILTDIISNQSLIDNNLKVNKDKSNINKSYYLKKQVKFHKLQEFQNRENSPLCPIHSLPLNVICINEKIKICSQCALNNTHLNHKIITEKDFDEKIEELSKIYQNMEINTNKYYNFKNNNFSLINEINQFFIEMQNNLTELKNKIINNLNNQFNSILNYIQLRKKEIFDKYKNRNYNISNLVKSSSNWIKIVSEKLNESNIKNNNKLKIDFSKFLDDDENKNIFNLIISGKEINERFNFVQEINSISDKLEEFKKTGITIKKNEDIINSLINNNKIIFIEEKEELIKNLNLSPYQSLLNKLSEIKKKKLNINLGINEVESEDNDKNNNNKDNIEKISNKKKSLKNRNENNIINKIYFRKIIGETGKTNLTESDKSNIKVNISKNKIKDKNGKSFSTNRNSISVGKKIKKKLILTDTNESAIPLFNNIYKMNKKLLRNNTATNINLKIPKNEKIKNNINNDSLEFSNDKNININFNGHIFNYNSDSRFSFNLPKNNKIEDSNRKINEILKILTPKKNENKNTEKNSEKPKIIRCFSFTGNKDNNNLKNIGKKNSSTSIPIKTAVNNSKINNIIYSCNNFRLNERKSNKKYDNFSLKTEIISIKNKKDKYYNYKTLTIKELEKYVNYQLKKLKPNFNRINLRDSGMKQICLFFKKNKNKKYKEIKLQGCNLNASDLELFTKSLIENNIIIPMINMSENKLTDDCTFIILDLINDYNELQYLTLTNNLFSKKIKEKIKEYFKVKKNELDDINFQI